MRRGLASGLAAAVLGKLFAAAAAVQVLNGRALERLQSLQPQEQLAPAASNLSQAPLASAQAWPGKNGDLWRTGQAASAAPLDLSRPTWVFEGYTEPAGSVSYATPVVDESGNVYVTNNGGAVFALKPDGSVRWSLAIEVLPTIGTMPMGAVCTPVLADGVLYFAGQGGVAYAVEAATGARIWRVRYAAGAGADAWSAALGGDVLILGGYPEGGEFNTAVYALNATTGAPLWSFTAPAGAFFFNVMPAIIGDSVVVSDVHGSVHRLGLGDGRAVFSAPAASNSSTTGGAAVDAPAGVIYVTSNLNGTPHWGAGFGGRGALRARSLETGDVLWERTFEMEANNAPALMQMDGGRVAVVVGLGNNANFPPPAPPAGDRYPGAVRAFDGASGADLWELPLDWSEQAAAGSVDERLCLPDAFSNAVVSSERVVYIGWQGGKVFAINGTSGAEISSYDLRSGVQGEGAIASGALYVASCDRLVAFKP